MNSNQEGVTSEQETLLANCDEDDLHDDDDLRDDDVLLYCFALPGTTTA